LVAAKLRAQPRWRPPTPEEGERIDREFEAMMADLAA
jgi:hypothetical protein